MEQFNADAKEPEKKYDVALSFLVQDLRLVQALNDGLSSSLSVFFFAERQEELAGTDGQETMRKPFLYESRLNVVIYRELWGHTPWTRVEASAIKDACLEQGWESLFVLIADPTSKPPIWLPKTHIRFNYGEFSLEQAIGAIKARVQERGGVFQPMTPLRQAELYRAEEAYRADKYMLDSPQEVPTIRAEVKTLFTAVEEHCRFIREHGHLDIRCEWSANQPSGTPGCVITTAYGSTTLNWQLYGSGLARCVLTVDLYAIKLILGSEMRGGMQYLETPRSIEKRQYLPDLSRARQLGWSEKGRGEGEFLSSVDLAQQCVIQLVKFIEARAEQRAKRNAAQW